VHEAIPENEEPLTAAATGWLYQLPESAGREGAAVAVGDEISSLMNANRVSVPPWTFSMQ
jgi:hypothetical protein